MEKLPINIDVLIWARTSIGLTIEEVAKKFKKTPKEILDWEFGITSPTYIQLEKLAFEIYKRPLAVFFFPSIPYEENPKTEFRTLPEIVASELPTNILKLYRNAKLFQYYLEEIFENKKPVDSDFVGRFSITKGSNVSVIAAEIRKFVGVSIEDQSKWNSTETAFKNWRNLLEANGIFVFKNAFKNDDYSGFCLYHDKYPVIYANNSMPFSRQVFTLFHELAHLLVRASGIDFRRNTFIKAFTGYFKDIEVLCNHFASEFLVPDSVIDSFELIISESQFAKLANYFSVSREVILRKYLERNIIDKKYYDEFSKKWIEESQNRRSEGEGGSYYNNKKAYLGDRYISLVYGKYYQNKINLDTVSQYLNVKMKKLPMFENIVMEGGLSK